MPARHIIAPDSQRPRSKEERPGRWAGAGSSSANSDSSGRKCGMLRDALSEPRLFSLSGRRFRSEGQRGGWYGYRDKGDSVLAGVPVPAPSESQKPRAIPGLRVLPGRGERRPLRARRRPFVPAGEGSARLNPTRQPIARSTSPTRRLRTELRAEHRRPYAGRRPSRTVSSPATEEPHPQQLAPDFGSAHSKGRRNSHGIPHAPAPGIVPQPSFVHEEPAASNRWGTRPAADTTTRLKARRSPLARLLAALHGDTYMVDAYTPAVSPTKKG